MSNSKELKFVKNENFKEKNPRQNKKSGNTDQKFLDMHSDLIKEILYRGNDRYIVVDIDKNGDKKAVPIEDFEDYVNSLK